MGKYLIVTSCTPQYLPGLIALRNSIEIFFPEASLACFYYGQGTTHELPKNIHYIHEAPMLGPIVSSGGEFRDGLKLGPDMYSRILIPKYFTGRVFYVDVDCVILQNLKDLFSMDLNGYPTACVLREDIGWVGGDFYDKMASGTFLCDTDKWEELNLVENIFQVMKDYCEGKIKRKFNVNVESSLAYAHNNNFLPLGREYQNLAYYGRLSKEDKVVHWGGPKPWNINGHLHDKNSTNYVDLWEAFYDKNVENVFRLISLLPEKLSEKVGVHERESIRRNAKGIKIK